jgi:hypothetical protein
MSIEIYTFYNYINSNVSNNITNFKNVFSDKINKLPDKIISSKSLIKHLDIKTNVEFKIFKNTFLDYFKSKLNRL